MLDLGLLRDPRALGDAIAGGRVALDDALQAAWTMRVSMPGLMRSDLSKMVRMPARSSDGTAGRFVVQVNPGRATRRVPGRVFDRVVAAFDQNAFHFAPGLVRSEEVLFGLELDGVSCEVLVNVSPLGECHCLLVVEPAGGLPQVLDERGLRAALALVRASSREDFKVGFNSLRACATVNHYHFQCLYLRGPGVLRDRMAVEDAPAGPELAAGMKRLSGYPIAAWKFDDGPHAARALATAVHVLQRHDTPHNLLLARRASVLIPRVAQDASGPSAGLAFLELSGEALVICEAHEDPLGIARCATDEQVERRIAAAAIPADVFARLEDEIVRSIVP